MEQLNLKLNNENIFKEYYPLGKENQENNREKNNDILKANNLNIIEKYFNLKECSNCLPSDPMNRRSYQKAIDKGYKNNKELVLIIGSSNDQRFDNMDGFTLTDNLFQDEVFVENDDKSMLPLRYDILGDEFFKDFKDFRFNKIIFDYNVIYFLDGKIKFSSIKYFWNILINILNIRGELYIPINFSPYEKIPIYDKSKIKRNIILDEDNRSYVVDNLNLNNKIVSLSKTNYKIRINLHSYEDKTPYLSYLNNIQNNLNNNFKSKIEQNEIQLNFYIDTRYIDYYKKSNYLINKIPEYDPYEKLFKFEPYPIEPRIMEEYMGDIKEYAKIIRLK